MSQLGLYLQVQHDESIDDRWNRDVCWRAAISSQLHKTFYQKKLPGSCYLLKIITLEIKFLTSLLNGG